MVTEPLLPTESARADLAEPFEHWRRSRATAQDRIPAALWDQAVALTTVLPGSPVAKRLRLSPTDRKQQGLARPTAIPATAVVPYPGVVEVTAPALEPAAPSPTLLEVERPEGAGWRLQLGLSAASGRAAGVSGAGVMLPLTPQRRIWLALAPVDFRTGIDGLAAGGRQSFARNPLDGAIYGFRNRTGTSLKLLGYDRQGFWLSRRLHNASLCNCSGRGSVARTAVRFSGE